MLCVVRYLSVASCVLIAGCAQTGSVVPSFFGDSFFSGPKPQATKAGCAKGREAAALEVGPSRPDIMRAQSAVPAGSAADAVTTVNLPDACRELNAALSAYKASDLDGAETQFKSSISLYTEDHPVMTPDDLVTALFGLAAVHDLQRRFADSDTVYDHIRTTFGESVRYFNNYGYSLYLRNDPDGARAQWQAGLKLAPENTTLLANLAKLPK